MSIKGFSANLSVLPWLATAAITVQVSAADLDTRSVQWLVTQLRVAEATNNPYLMNDTAHRLEQVFPDHPDALATRAIFALQGEERALGIELIKKLQRLYPRYDNLNALLNYIDVTGPRKGEFQQARLYAKAGRYQDALAIYEQLFQGQFPTAATWADYISWLGEDDKQWAKVNNLYRQLNAKYPGIAIFEIDHASHILKKHRQDQSAFAVFKKYAHHPDHENLVSGRWLRALQRLPINNQTLAMFEEYVATYPLSDEAKGALADVKLALAAQRKQQSNPYYQAWQKAERLMAQEQTYAEAEQQLNYALSGWPTNPDVLGSMGILQLRKGEHALAQGYFEQAFKHAGDVGDAQKWQGLKRTARFWELMKLESQAVDQQNYSAAAQLLHDALALNEDNNTVLERSAELMRLQGKSSQAEQLYREVLRKEPLNSTALTGLLALARDSQDLRVIQQFLQSLTAAQRQLLQDDSKGLERDLLREQAKQAEQQGQFAKAEQALDQAIALAPEDAWLLYDKAKLLQRQQQPQQAQAVFQNALWRFPLNADIRYAYALLLQSLDQFQLGYQVLAEISAKRSSSAIVALRDELWLQQQLRQAEQQYLTNDLAASQQSLAQIAIDDRVTGSNKALLAQAWYRIGEPAKAIHLLQSALTDPGELSLSWHLTLAQWLSETGQTNRALAVLSPWQQRNDLTSEQQQQVQSGIAKIYLAKAEQEHGDTPWIEQFLAQYPDNPFMLQEAGEKALAEQRDNDALRIYQRLATLSPDDLAVQIQYLQLAADDDEDRAVPLAEQLVQRVAEHSSSTPSYLQHRLMKSLAALPDEQALPLAEQLVNANANDSELHYYAADLAKRKRHYELAKPLYSAVLARNSAWQPEQPLPDSMPQGTVWFASNARTALEEIAKQQNGHIAVGFNFMGQTSTQSDSSLGVGGMMTELYYPLFDRGQAFVKLDPVVLQAQRSQFTEAYSASQFGTGFLCYPLCQTLSIRPLDRGVAWGVGWQQDNLRLDIGSTPQGFLLSQQVYGLQYGGSIGSVSWDIDLSKRPVTSTVLSYAGLQDPETGRVWGGVAQTGASLGFYYDQGEQLGLWSQLSYHQYRGENVLNNRRYRAMLGSYYRLLQQADVEFSLGASLLHWGYQHNLSGETFGHGGYYSPQSYWSLGIPLTLSGFTQNWSYRLRASLAYSMTRTDDIDYFPTDSQYQQLALSRAAIMDRVPVYAGESSNGLSYSLSGEFEYRLTPHWYLGGSLSIDRAEFYQPNFAQFFIRYDFAPNIHPLDYNPRLMVPYSNF